MINKSILKKGRNKGFNDEEIYEAYKIFFGTLVSEQRLKIINFLRKGKKSVSEIMKELRMNQTSVSHNLSRLKKCGFVKSEIKGKYRYYELDKKTILPLMNLINKHMLSNCIHILNNKKKA
ncbi:MAG: metalloregulator ArsR/SmtB family transcription factor [Candidatus Pacearchaeota archaeon]